MKENVRKIRKMKPNGASGKDTVETRYSTSLSAAVSRPYRRDVRLIVTDPQMAAMIRPTGTSLRKRPILRETRYSASLQGGVALLEIVIALLLSLTAFLVAAPALALSLKILTVDRTGLDQEIAVEAAWSEVCASPSQFARAGQKDFGVGENRSLTVQITPLESQDGLRRWRLSVPLTGYGEERWLAK